ncbi:1,4-alpha-glucan branching protein GlgB [Mediterraneibacter catenae]|uniref:1,4-alpha-glucan branching enzyme n=1 Tax=Mediterraneibacter catenae TaxID=2594882 RepID=A0A5M9HZZ1_9FIRM|nr:MULTISPECIES: 1,4-alpha-glucan branching protein GlgB [Mediterraneibacter]KAA8500475.1 1,4-alpha-glucan branching protein GlgB [Mediterraneibacter catenae]MCF2568298.1 1,4-alpha-glucan branching protein GlgB [Mediterraneibacter glycyrrhizinilyticus]
MDFYGFYTGKIFDAYKYLGAHINRGKSGKAEEVVFRTFAPSASRISVIGEFNGWTETPMEKVHDGNFWELISKEAKPGMMYKYRIYDRAGNCIDHCDPYGYGMELRPNTASIIRDMDAYKFHDGKWMKKRSDHSDLPLNVYELHFGSFRKPSEEPDAWYDYEEMADILLPYLKENGYNYLEIMPLNEYPCDESWGYQGTGFFSPTSRYGTADQLKYFVDRCHENDIGVILDFVPVHFAVDDYALANYDGTALYEYPHSDVGDSEWGSRNFMHSRGEVRSFLQSAAEYWLNEYHIDGLRMDAISRAIYWQGMPERGVNSNAVEFLRYMNQGLKERHPSVILAAEDSTSFPGVTKPAEEGGLGFDYKWDMGWMNDTLDYFRTAPEYRTRDYHKLTFSMMYYYDERYLLPLSHDEVVHGKATILQKMYGDYGQKFPQARAFYMYMYTHPGKKLNFMGNEIGHFREWDEKRELDWNLLTFPAHQDFHRFMEDLNHFYLEHPALSELDYDMEGFQWLECHAEEKCVYVFERCTKERRNETGKSRDQMNRQERIVAAFNFSDEEQEIEIKCEDKKSLKRVFSSEYKEYGGQEEKKEKIIKAKKEIATLKLKPFSAEYYLIQSCD